MKTLEKAIISNVWSPDTYEQHKDGKLPNSLLSVYADKLRKLSEQYSKPRKQLRPKLDKEAATAYTLYYLPINFYKIKTLLKLLSNDFNQSKLRILDIGAGPGTASLACLSTFKQSCELFLIEPNPYMQHHAVSLLEYYRTLDYQFNYQFINKENVTDFEAFDLIIASNVFNECTPGVTQEYLELISEKLTPGGALLIVEPALQSTTRKLMHLKEDLLHQIPKLSVHYPCFHQKPCPMLQANDKDWCHSQLGWERPTLILQLDQLTGFNKHKIKLSSMLFKCNKNEQNALRIVSLPKYSNKGSECLVCGKDYYGNLSIPKKHPSAKALKKAKMHDIIENLEISANQEQKNITIRSGTLEVEHNQS